MAYLPVYPQCVVGVNLNEVFLNSAGAPLANGYIEFYNDNNRSTPQLVYQLTGSPGAYSYAALDDPVVLGATGSPVNNTNENIAIYYYPYDQSGNMNAANIQNYFIKVYDENDVLQFTRQGWPNATAETIPEAPYNTASNMLTNPQFTQINFLPDNPLTIQLVGGDNNINIAPGWVLYANVTLTSTSVQIQRIALSGQSAVPYQAPYYFYVVPAGGIRTLQLIQTLNQNPNIFASNYLNPTVGGYAAVSITLANSSAVSIVYAPSTVSPSLYTTLLTANNTTGLDAEFTGTVQIPPFNTATPDSGGYVNIIINLSTGAPTKLTNVQLTPSPTQVNINYNQVTANRELDQMFNYYNALLQYKPIPSYLIGWDFPLNPAQFLGTSVVAKPGTTNNCQYVWDQTILFSSADTGAAVTRSASGNGALRVTATNTTQFAIVQYLPQSTARKILNDDISAMVQAICPQAGGLTATISLWYAGSTVTNLPSASANACVVTGLDANGFPTVPTGWAQVTRNGLGNAQFTVGNSTTTNFNDYGFSGWNANGVSGINQATYFAIVVGFSSLTAGQYIDIGAVSLVPGKIATVPAPKSWSETFNECQHYYQKSFNVSQRPVTALGLQTGEYYGAQNLAVTGTSGTYYLINVPFGISMINAPAVTIYNPKNANNQIYNPNTNTDCGGINAAVNISQRGCVLNSTVSIAGTSYPACAHWSADARLGK